MASIGENIKRFRKGKKLTQVELAKIAGISRSYLADVERDRYNPSIETLTAISRVLNVHIGELLGVPGMFVPENGDLYETLRLTLMRMSEGPLDKRRFKPYVLSAIESESEYLGNIYQVNFELTPDGITEACEKLNDDYFTVEVIKMLEGVERRESGVYNAADEKEQIKALQAIAERHHYNLTDPEFIELVNQALDLIRTIRGDKKE